MSYCDTNDCERPGCHRCNPRVNCTEHEKCRDFAATQGRAPQPLTGSTMTEAATGNTEAADRVEAALIGMIDLIQSGRYHRSGNPYSIFPEFREAIKAVNFRRTGIEGEGYDLIVPTDTI